MPFPTPDQERANQRNAVLSGFLGWTLDAFDFFVLIFVVSAIAKEFGKSIPAIALTITASLAMRPIGAFTFGVLADRYGRRYLLIANIIFYSIMEMCSGLAHSYQTFFLFRVVVRHRDGRDLGRGRVAGAGVGSG